MSLQTPQPIKDPSQDSNNKLFYRELLYLKGQVIDIDDTGVVAGVEFAVEHGMRRVPSQVEVLVKEGQTAGYLSVQPGATAWTNTTIYLLCNTNNCNLRLRLT